jgi:hypothetical protein
VETTSIARRCGWRQVCFAADRRRLGITFVLLLLIVLLGACASDQGRLVVVDAPGVFDQSRIAAAAQPLLARGVALAVIAVDRGDDRGDDFTRQLDETGLIQGGRIAPQAIAVYVSFDPRYSELRAGSRWSPSLPNDVLRAIRLETLNPALPAGDATGGVAATLAALDQRLAVPARRPWWQVAGMALVCVPVLLVYLVAFAPSVAQFVWVDLGLGRPAGWLGGALARSAPGRLLGWLWDRSPPARALARRRLREASRWARYALTMAADRAHKEVASWMRRCAPEISAGIGARLQLLDARRSALAPRPPDDPGLPAELRRLADDYTQCGDLAREVWGLEQKAGSARRWIEEALASGGYVAPAPRGGKGGGATAPAARGGKRKRKRAAANPLDAATPEALARLGDRLAELDRRRAALPARLPGGDHAELVEKLIAPLQKAYNRLGHDAHAPWAALFPDRAEAEGRAVDALFKSYMRSAQRGSSDQRGASSGPSIASAGASDEPSWSGSSSAGSGSSSEPSSDGGSW